jgi:hypothetical protein
MAEIPLELHEHINEALIPNTPLIGTVDSDGYPRISLRGSTCVYDEETIAFWERSGRGAKENLEDGAKVSVFFQKPELRESILPIAGVARFFGTVTIHTQGEIRDAVWNKILPAERERDPEKNGFAVLIAVERAENLAGQPLS